MSEQRKNSFYWVFVALICITTMGIVACTPQGSSAGCHCTQCNMKKKCGEHKCGASTCDHHKKSSDAKRCG